MADYDAVGLADLVRKKQVSAHELLDEAIARTAKVDPQINAVVVKHYDYAAAPDRQGIAGRSLHRRAVPAEGSRYSGGDAYDVRRDGPEGFCRRSYRYPRPALSRCRRHDLRQELQPGIRPDADHGVPAASARPAIPGISRTPPAVRRAARPRRLPRVSFPLRMPATAAVRSGSPPPPAAYSE